MSSFCGPTRIAIDSEAEELAVRLFVAWSRPSDTEKVRLRLAKKALAASKVFQAEFEKAYYKVRP